MHVTMSGLPQRKRNSVPAARRMPPHNRKANEGSARSFPFGHMIKAWLANDQGLAGKRALAR